MQTLHRSAFINRSSRPLRIALALVGIGVGLLALPHPERPASHSLPLRRMPTAPASPSALRHKTSVPGSLSATQASTASAMAELKRRGLYTSLQQAMQTALYRIEAQREQAGNYTADNPAQRYSVQFGAADIAVRVGSDRHASHSLRLRLSGVEAGGERIALVSSRLRAKGERMEYDRGVVREWYANTPKGLEQGFTVLHQPVSGKQGDLRIRLAVSGDWQGHLSQDGNWVDFRGSGGSLGLRYGKLQAWDARGRRLGSHLRLSGSELALAVDTRGAVYPVRIDPLMVGTCPTLTPSDPAQNNYFGGAVCLSGNTALISATDSNASYIGAVYVFVQSGGVWLQQAKLTASDGAADDEFGSAVSLSGNTALIGAQYKASNTGAAYVFVQNSGAWTQQAKLTASDGAAGDYFGSAVSLSGNTALIGANGKASYTGAAYMFTSSGGVWTQQAKLAASDTVQGDGFGQSVSLSGNMALIGAPYKATDTGAAYVFTGSGGVWTQQAKLTASDGAQYSYFSWSAVSLSGNTALIGAEARAFNTGAAYIYTGNNGVWTQQQELTASDGAQKDDFGIAVSLSGNTALIGADGNASYTGAAYIFVQSGGVWTQQQELTASDAATGDHFGYAVSLSGNTALVGAWGKTTGAGAAYTFPIGLEQTASNGAQNDQFGYAVSISGNTALVGAPFHNNPYGTGTAYVFVLSNGTWTLQQELDGSDDAGTAVSLNGDTALISAYQEVFVLVRNGGVWTFQAQLFSSDGATSFGHSVSLSGNTALIGASVNNEGVVYVFVRNNGVWTQQAELTASDEAQNDGFGNAVSLSGNIALIGAPLKASGTGAAYVFVGNNGVWTQQAELTSGYTGGEFGYAVSVSGNTALVGAPFLDGAAVFVQNGGVWTQQAILTANDAFGNLNYFVSQLGQSVSLSGNIALLGASDTNFTSGNNVGDAYVFVRRNGVWTLQQELTASDAAPGDYFGQAVSLSGSAILVGAPGKATSTGAVYIQGQSLLAQADTYTAYVNTPLSVTNAEGVLANDTDPFALPLTAQLLVPPDNGSLTFNPDGSFLYTPDADFSGTDTFSYQATDGSGTSDLAWVTLNVISPIPPVIADLDPSEGAAGGSQMALWVNGMDFTTGSVVSVNSTPIPTLFLSDSQLLALVPASYLSTVATLSIQVNNPQPNGASNTLSLPVVSFLASVSTPTFVIGGASTTLTLHLSPAAPLGGLSIAVSSNQPIVAQPVVSQVTVPTGQPSMMVTVNTTAVTKQTTVKLTGSVGGASASASLIVLPPQPSGHAGNNLPLPPPSPHGPGLHG
jgi:hypothetical protein